jgi:hypothetical protein
MADGDHCGKQATSQGRLHAPGALRGQSQAGFQKPGWITDDPPPATLVC